VLAVAVVAGVAAILHTALSGPSFTYRGSAAPAFSFSYDGLERVAPRPGELVRLERRGAQGELDDLVTASPVRLGGAAEPVSSSLPFAAAAVERRAHRELPGLREILEGRAHVLVDHGPAAWQFGFLAPDRTRPGHVIVGKVLVVPERGDRPRRAVALELVESSDEQKVAEAAARQPSGLLLNYPVRDLEQVEVAAQTSGRIERPVKTFELL
jgi:hypothetical protein